MITTSINPTCNNQIDSSCTYKVIFKVPMKQRKKEEILWVLSIDRWEKSYKRVIWLDVCKKWPYFLNGLEPLMVETSFLPSLEYTTTNQSKNTEIENPICPCWNLHLYQWIVIIIIYLFCLYFYRP